jgi:hypothetical protein
VLSIIDWPLQLRFACEERLSLMDQSVSEALLLVSLKIMNETENQHKTCSIVGLVCVLFVVAFPRVELFPGVFQALRFKAKFFGVKVE